MSCLSRSAQTSSFHWQICPGAVCPSQASCHLVCCDCLVFCYSNVACAGEALTWGDYDADVCGYRRTPERRVLTDSCPFQLSTPVIWMHTGALNVTALHDSRGSSQRKRRAPLWPSWCEKCCRKHCRMVIVQCTYLNIKIFKARSQKEQ